MNRSITIIIIWLTVFSLIPLVGCSDDTAAPPPNNPPTIELTVDKLAVPRDIKFALTVDVDDPDGDPVSVNWAVTRDGQPSGSLEESEQGGASITWTPPTITGRDTITAVATDGKGGSTTLVETIQTGWLHTEIIVGNQTWPLHMSPHIVRGNGTEFVIAARALLAADQGVEILIDRPELEIKSAGRIETNGTAGSIVKIQPNSRTPEPGYWLGITASPDGAFAPRTELTHTEILYATNAVKSTTVAEARLNGCRIMFSSESAVLHRSSGELRVENSVITNNEKSGIRIERLPGVPKPVNVVISGDSIAVNGDVTGQTVYRDQAAIFIDMPDTNAITPIEISHNEISRNGTPGIQLVTGVFPEIHQNVISGNEFGKAGSRYNIILGQVGGNGFGGGSYPDIVDARYNYWGGSFAEADSATIKAAIRDSENSGGVPIDALVVVYPWLNTEP